jgi:hypothetical protein
VTDKHDQADVLLKDMAAGGGMLPFDTWSSIFSHVAMGLAAMYILRGDEIGQTVEEWLARVFAAEGGNTMVSQIKHAVERARAPLVQHEPDSL